MKLANIDVAIRDLHGRNRVRHVRESGDIPAVLYGRGGENRSLTLPGRQFEKLVLTHHKLFELHFKDGGKEEAYLHDMQWDALTDDLVHVDFRRIDLKEKMQVQVEVRFVGVAKGLSNNGVFEAPIKMLSIECLPSDLPESIRVNVNDLDIGDTLLVQDLQLPSGVAATDEADSIVCLVKQRVENVEPEDEGEEGGEAEPEVIGKGDDGDSDG